MVLLPDRFTQGNFSDPGFYPAREIEMNGNRKRISLVLNLFQLVKQYAE